MGMGNTDGNGVKREEWGEKRGMGCPNGMGGTNGNGEHQWEWGEKREMG